MKKIMLITMALLVVFSMSAFAQVNVKVGMDFFGEYSLKGSEGINESEVKNGFTIAGEYVIPYSDEIELGAGVAYQIARGFDEEDADEDEKFNFIPIYGMVKYNIDQFYVLGQLGYNMFKVSVEMPKYVELEGGLYYGVGGGMNITDNIFGEILYSVNNGSIVIEGQDDVDVSNSQISAMVGFSF